MKAVIQRVNKASVEISGKTVGKIDQGLLVFLGITHSDTDQEIDYIITKLLNLRLFESQEKPGHFDKSVVEIKGGILVVSQFTLYANTQKGRRPSFDQAAKPEEAEALYNKFVDKLKTNHKTVQTGKFGAKMTVAIENDGPVTILLEK